MPVPDLAVWSKELENIPEDQFPEFMRALFAEKDRRTALPMIRDAAEKERRALVAALSAVLPEPDLTKPRQWAPFTPSDRASWFFYGQEATHQDQAWLCVLDPDGKTPAIAEPGAEPREWQPAPEPEIEPESE